MSIRESVFKLTGVQIMTDDFWKLKKYPEKYTKTTEEAMKIKELMDLLSDSKRIQKAIEDI